MKFEWDAPLKPWMLPNPVLHHEQVSVTGVRFPTTQELKTIFPKGHSLKTWGKELGVKTTDPHWIGVRGQTPLHTDPRYERYTHHLLVRADRLGLRGYDKKSIDVYRGLYLVLDTHSPHQVFAKTKTALWYVAVSIDSEEVISKELVLPRLLEYGRTADFLIEGLTKPNNGGRFTTA